MAQTIVYQPQKFTKGQAPPKRTGGVVRVFGMKGSGKSTFAIKTHEVAQPLIYCNFDFRDASHLLKQYEGDEYYYEAFHRPTSQADAKAQLEKLRGMRNAAISLGKGVFVIDNEANAWGLIKRALLPDEGKKPLPREYELANDEMGLVLTGPSEAGLWVVSTAPAKKIWFGAKTDSIDGQTFYSAAGWNPSEGGTEFVAVGQIWLFLDTKPLGALAVPDPAKMFTYKYKGQIIDAKNRTEVEGAILDDPSLALFLKAIREG